MELDPSEHLQDLGDSEYLHNTEAGSSWDLGSAASSACANLHEEVAGHHIKVDTKVRCLPSHMLFSGAMHSLHGAPWTSVSHVGTVVLLSKHLGVFDAMRVPGLDAFTGELQCQAPESAER